MGRTASIMKHLLGCDLDGSGTISLDELEEAIKTPEVMPLLKSMGMSEADVLKLFLLLDCDRSGEIEAAELTAGCFRLQGSLKAIDFASFLVDFWSFMNVFYDHMHYIEDVIERTYAKTKQDGEPTETPGHQMQAAPIPVNLSSHHEGFATPPAEI